MGKKILQRLLYAGMVLLFLSLATFLLLQASPVDPVALRFAQMGTPIDPELAQEIRSNLGLDAPLPWQYWHWLTRLLQGDWGYSLTYGEPVFSLICVAAPQTARLAFGALCVALIITLPLATLAFYAQGRIGDFIVRVFSLLSISIPTFWLSLLLLLIFGVKLHWISIANGTNWQGMILPSIALGIWLAGLYIRRLRTALLEEAGKGYAQSARLLGVGERHVFLRNLLPNASLVLLPMLGISVGNILCGSAVIETIFGWHGMGEMMTTAILARDYALMQAYALWGGMAYILSNALADVLLLYLDPRRRKKL